MEIETVKSDVGMKWEMVRFGDIATLSKGKKHNPVENGTNRYINIENLHNASNSLFTNESGVFVEEKDLIIAWDGANAGKVGVGFKGVIGSTLARIKINDKESDARFLYWFLESKNELIKSQRTGATIPHVNGSALKDLQIPLPPLPIQRRIADILDAADALRRKDQELLQKYDELAQAIFIDMFGDPDENPHNFEIIDLEDICDEIIDCPHSTPVHSDGITNYPCIRTSEMKNGKIIWGKMKYLDYENYLLRTKRLVPKAGDIVYAREGTYGEAVLLPDGFDFALGQRTMLFRINSKKCDNHFIWYFINSDFVYQQAKRKNMGSTVGHVNVADVKKFKILLPPFELQKKFNDFLRITNKLYDSISINLHSDNLFQTLLQKAFKGELVA